MVTKPHQGGSLDTETLRSMTLCPPTLITHGNQLRAVGKWPSPLFYFQILACWHIIGRTKLTIRTLDARESEKYRFYLSNL